MKPPFAYFGGKVKMAKLIVSLMPPHRVYIEPFFGSGAVLFRKPPATHEIVNDLDRQVVNFFRVLRDRPTDLERACMLTPHSRDEFDAADLAGDVDDLEMARRFWVRITQSFGQTANESTGWSITVAANGSRPLRMVRHAGRFAAIAERLAGVTIENDNAIELLRLAKTSDTVVYADPPYVQTSRATRSSRAGGVMDYRVDMGDDASHERLAEVLRATPATVFLSGYHSPLYDRLYHDWHLIEIDTHCASSNSHTTDRRKRIEVLWSNRPIDDGRLFAPPS